MKDTSQKATLNFHKLELELMFKHHLLVLEKILNQRKKGKGLTPKDLFTYFKEIHTLKGACTLVEFKSLAKTLHYYEEILLEYILENNLL